MWSSSFILQWLVLSTPCPDVRAGMRWIETSAGAVLVVVPGHGGDALVVGAGASRDAETVHAALVEHGVTRVGLWIMRSPACNELGGFPRIVAGADGELSTPDDLAVDLVWDTGSADSSCRAAYLYLAKSREEPLSGSTWSAYDTNVVVWNMERSLSVCIRSPARRVFATVHGAGTDLEVVAAMSCGPADVLWVGGGSQHATVSVSRSLLEASDPRAIFLAAGSGGNGCEPSVRTLAGLRDRVAWLFSPRGVDPRGGCPSIAHVLDPDHTVWGGSVWLPRSP
ncbi:MAG: hypothetical protein V3V08_01905 [Nannocystaceae bacterium]